MRLGISGSEKIYIFFGCLQIIIFSKGALPYYNNYTSTTVWCISAAGCYAPSMLIYTLTRAFEELKLGPPLGFYFFVQLTQ